MVIGQRKHILLEGREIPTPHPPSKSLVEMVGPWTLYLPNRFLASKAKFAIPKCFRVVYGVAVLRTEIIYHVCYC